MTTECTWNRIVARGSYCEVVTSPSNAPRYRLPPEPGTQPWGGPSQPQGSSTPPQGGRRFSYPWPVHQVSDQQIQDRPVVDGISVLARLCALIYLLMIGIAVLLPDPKLIAALKLKVAHVVQRVAHHIAEAHPTAVGDVASNIAAFVPVTLLLALAWRKVPLWIWGIAGMLISTAAELLQFLLPQIHRRPYFWNVVENSVGGWIGIAVAAVLFQLGGRHHERERHDF